MRSCANVSILFREVPLLGRFGRAREAGFLAVEFWWPLHEELSEVEGAIRAASLDVALFNFDAGDMLNGDRGLLSDPERQRRFRENAPVAPHVADTSTISPVVTEELAGKAQEKGASMLDAPVSGGGRGHHRGHRVHHGRRGGGLRACQALFEVMCGAVSHVGPTGAGQVVKAATRS